MRVRTGALAWVALLAACASRAPESADLPASRDDVTAALYKQLELVLARHEELAHDETPAALREREELARTAGEISVHLARLDPNADLRTLIEQAERAR